MTVTQEKTGIIHTLGAYALWGVLPIYWKLLDRVSPGETLAHRIIWSAIFMLILVLSVGKWHELLREWKALMQDRRKFIGILMATTVISLNWLTFIWAVHNDHVIQASLGYYINPLISILLGILVLKESFTFRQTISFIMAAIGVLYLTISYGVFPWISLLLATSFGLYGLLKKKIDIGPMMGLTIETMLISPVALLFLWFLPQNTFQWSTVLSTTNMLLIGAGIVTAIPLLLFASGAKRISLSMIGFLQYLAPTLMLLLGVFLFNEPFTSAHFIAFLFIWLALINYLLASYQKPTKKQFRKAN